MAKKKTFAGHFAQLPLAGHFDRREFTPLPDMSGETGGFHVLLTKQYTESGRMSKN